MTKVEVERRAKIITAMLALWNCAGNEEMITGYVALTKDIPVELLDAACQKVSLECENRPLPATILKAAKSLRAEVTGRRVKSWDEAWEEIDQQMRVNGIYAAPHFSTVEIEKTVLRYGWRDLCCAPSKDMPIIKAQMREIYKTLCSRSDEKGMNEYIITNHKVLEVIGNTAKLLPGM